MSTRPLLRATVVTLTAGATLATALVASTGPAGAGDRPEPRLYGPYIEKPTFYGPLNGELSRASLRSPTYVSPLGRKVK